MTARFIHIGDLHLGPNARNVDRMAALDQILNENADTMLAAANGPVSAWLWPGDLNHGRQSIEDKNFLTERVLRMAGVAPVVIVPGNHDLDGDLDYLQFLGAFYPIYVVTTPQVLLVDLPTGGRASIFCLPYPKRHALVAAGVPSEEVSTVARDALAGIFNPAIDTLRMARGMGHITLMIGHVNVGGSIVSTGQPNIGREIELDPGLLAPFGPIYIGLNHIHKGQQAGPAWYPGSCCRLDWGEVDPKRYLSIEYAAIFGDPADADDPANPPPSWRYRVIEHPLDVAPLWHIEGELTRDGFRSDHDELLCGECGGDGDGDAALLCTLCDARYDEGSREVGSPCVNGAVVEGAMATCTGTLTYDTLPCEPCGGSGRRSFVGAEVRVRYRFNIAEKEALDDEKVRSLFVGAKRLTVEPIAVNKRAARAPEVAAAHSVEEKAQAFARHAGIDWSPGLDAKLSLLQLPDGAAFLTEVQRQLAPPVAEPAEASA